MSRSELTARAIAYLAELIALALRGDRDAIARVESILPPDERLAIEREQQASREEAAEKFGT